MNSDDSDDENPIRYGTPLDPIEEDEIPAKRKPQPTEQYAVDAHGRRRFHGAFTGGFSAGFGNSVGSAEGWTPASFKSSRSEKAAVSSRRPEDFMDEEDRDEFGIAPIQMQTQSDFAGRKRTTQQRFFDGIIPGQPILEQLLRPVHETAAVKLLKAMGWREGRGAGGKVNKMERKKAREQHKVYGCHVPEEFRQNLETQSNESSDSEFEYDQLFEPEDYEPYIVARKNDTFGLGYSGLSRHSVLGDMTGEYGTGSNMSHLVMKEKGKKVSIRGQAFGVGAFEDDDQDIYALEDMSHYDFEMGGPSKPAVKNKNKDRQHNLLPGFVKAVNPPPSINRYPPPALPRDYRPTHRKTRFEQTAEPQRDQGLGRHELSAEARGQLLGETQQSNTQPDKADLIAKITGRNINFTSQSDLNTNAESSKSIDKEMDFIPIKDTGKEIVNVFKPFKSDPKKQSRYESYLSDRNSVLEREGTDKLSEWERNREMAEFEQAAKLYKPLTGAIGDRFTHASEPDDAVNPLAAVAKSSINYGLATRDQIDAANKGVYGVMTRTVIDWRPEGIVCKRFNVPEIGGSRPEKQKDDKPKVSYSIFSYLESSVHNKDSFTKEQSKFSGSKSLGFDKNTPNVERNKIQNEKPLASASITKATEDEPSQSFNKRLTVAELFMKESEKVLETKEVEVTTTIEKFDKMDLYKSIFLSDTEDEEEDSKTNEMQSDKDRNVDYREYIDTPKNTERNTSPPKGIFANINFDELNSWKRNMEADSTKTVEPDKDKNKPENYKIEKDADKNLPNNEEEVYGPKIPEKLQTQIEATARDGDTFKPTFKSRAEREKQTIEVGSSSSDDAWVEAKEKSKKSSKKKSKKHKSKHKKSKHKKKDR